MRNGNSGSKWSRLCPAHLKAMKTERLKGVIHKLDVHACVSAFQLDRNSSCLSITCYLYYSRRNPDVLTVCFFLSPGYKTTNDTAQGLSLLNSKHGSSFLNTTTTGYSLQRTCPFLQGPPGSSMTWDSN
jgi:hypothetical protein